MKIRAEINDIETYKITQEISETKSWFYEKINKIDKKKRERTQINNIRNWRQVRTYTKEIQRILRKYY